MLARVRVHLGSPCRSIWMQHNPPETANQPASDLSLSSRPLHCVGRELCAPLQRAPTPAILPSPAQISRSVASKMNMERRGDQARLCSLLFSAAPRLPRLPCPPGG